MPLLFLEPTILFLFIFKIGWNGGKRQCCLFIIDIIYFALFHIFTPSSNKINVTLWGKYPSILIWTFNFNSHLQIFSFSEWLHTLGIVSLVCFLHFRYVEANTLMNNYAHIFDLLTRLRQVNN